MADLPTGTVTFLFTDIEGSTELLTSLGARYAQVLERHHALLREAFAARGGREVDTEGDAFFVAFTSAPDALAAAVNGQRALLAEKWPDNGEVRVRMGLHTGAGVLGAGSYVGLDVHRAARVAAAGHGGQILVSDSTRALTNQALPDGASLRDLGNHRLKGLPAPERIYQLVVDGLPSAFPAIRSLDSRPNNLPVALTSFVGRETQIAQIRERLSSTRLLTMTGPGGTGKTRLCIRVAEEVIADYEHGCWFVALDALRDPALVPSTIADSLEVRVPADRPVMETLESWLAERRLLLVIDNFEQVADGAVYVTQLLRAAGGVRVLATSRVPLRVPGEQEYPVPPLTAGSELRAAAIADPATLSQFEAVQLFVERAVAIKPDFDITSANASAVAEICARLDGLPLAIELAAARVKLLSPQEMLGRLEHNIALLASTSRDLPERQRTLRGAIDWSHDLLDEPERHLFARLSIFSGGFTLSAAERICCDDDLGVEVLDGLSALVDNSLVRVDPSSRESRFAMLETIREFAREKLESLPEAQAVTKRHGEFFLEVATSAGAQITGPAQASALEALQRDRDNLRAAFERAPQVGLLNEALAAAGAMWRFWQMQGEFAEGRAIFERLLAFPDADPRARAAALTGAGGLAYWQGDVDALARDYTAAREIYESLGDEARLAEALYNESFVPIMRGDHSGAPPLLGRALELYERVGDDSGAAEALDFLGLIYVIKGDGPAAVATLERAMVAFRRIGAPWRLADGASALAYAYGEVGDWSRSLVVLRESLSVFKETGSEIGMAIGLQTAAALAAWSGSVERAALILGKVDEVRLRVGGGAPGQILSMDPYIAKARDELGDAKYEELHAQGMLLSEEEIVKLATDLEVRAGTAPLGPPVGRVGSAAIS